MPIPTIKPIIFSRYGELVSGMSTRNGGVSKGTFGMNLSLSVGDDRERVRENRVRFFTALGADSERVAFARQVHSAVVRYVDGPGEYHECDGLVTDRPGVYLAVSVADCVPILLYDPVQRVIAALHAGWRGTEGGIAANGVGLLKTKCGAEPSNILAYIGPAAGVCCYEVGEEVSGRFDGRYVRRTDGRIFLDLKGVNKAQLAAAGVAERNIEVSSLCTITERALLHSYRRDGPASGRMLAVIGIKG